MISKINRLFNLLLIRNYRKIDGWLTQREALGLLEISKKLPKNATVVEIGSWQGKSTFCIAQGLRSGKIYAIDPFNADGGFDESSSEDYKRTAANINLFDNFRNNLAKAIARGQLVVKRGYSFDYASEFEEIDFLFIDGDHSIEGCQRDYELYKNKIKIGGILALHDYNPQRKELGPTFVIEKLIVKSADFLHLGTYDSLWVAKKIR